MADEKSPCDTCKRVCADAKLCTTWRDWFVSRWNLIHGYYLKYVKPLEEEKEAEDGNAT